MQGGNQRISVKLGGCIALLAGLCATPLLPGSASAGDLLKSSALAGADKGCIGYAIEAEEKNGIPSGLLVAISLVESGRGGAPQAYAMNVAGRSIYAKNSTDAVRHLRGSDGKLRSNSYVGCMQLSVGVHSRQFGQLEQMIQPRHNVNFAANLLTRLHRQEGSWRSALARYNGGSQRVAQNYICKVWSHLNELDNESARLLESYRCSEPTKVAIAPRTRSQFEGTRSQVAEVPQ